MKCDRLTDRSVPETSNPLKDAANLTRNRHVRNRTGTFFAEGVRNFVHAVDQRFTLEHILYSDKLLIAPVARKLVRSNRRKGVKTTNLSPEDFRKITTTKRASGVAAIVQQRWASLSSISADQGLFWVMLETVQSPGNLGTLIRSSQAAGGAGFIFVGNTPDPYAPNVIRSAMGAAFHQSYVRTNWANIHSWVATSNATVIGVTSSGSASLHKAEYPHQAPILVLGEERKGLSTRQIELCTQFVRIPMQEGSDSLNLGVAGSLMMYEIRRQHSQAI